jgi:hypothetical protein
VRRILLVLAMALSLWPAAVIAASVANGSSNKETSQPSSGNGGATTPPGYARLKELQGQEEKLLQRFHNSATHGAPDPGLAESAHELVSSYETWESENGGQNAEADKAEGLEVRIAQRVASFAAHPSQSAMDAFNNAVTEYNSNVR